MNKKELEVLAAESMADVVRRRQLGGYNADATDIQKLCERELKLINHLIEQISRKEQVSGKKK